MWRSSEGELRCVERDWICDYTTFTMLLQPEENLLFKSIEHVQFTGYNLTVRPSPLVIISFYHIV